MSGATRIRLKKDEDRRIRAGHLWVFSNEIDTRTTPLAGLEPGSIVEVEDARGGLLGSGYANPHSLIAIRLLTHGAATSISKDLLRARLNRAITLRDRLFRGLPFYRLAYGESDGLPGLVVDRFGAVLVVQITTAGMERWQDDIVDILRDATGASGILLRADAPAREHEQLPLFVSTAHGAVPDTVSIVENGVRFEVPIVNGQKTGWFYDHRSNRARLRPYAEGARVLDVFSYVGGWGVQAAVFGASRTVCLDSSALALRMAASNAEINGVADRFDSLKDDAFTALQRYREDNQKFDVVILDPPAFIKRRKDIKEGERAYHRLNRLAMDIIPAGGILVSASCSFHLERDALLRAILWGASRSGRDVQVVEEGHQGPDHPFHPAVPETNYLKAFFVRMLS